MRIAHLPSPVSGVAYNLSIGEKSIGLDSKVYVLYNNWLKYNADKVIFEKPMSISLEKEKYIFLKTLLEEFNYIKKNHEIFHLNFGSSIIDFQNDNLDFLDVPFYKKNGKVIMSYYGCDAKQKFDTIKKYNISPCHNPKCYEGKCNNGVSDHNRKRRIKKISEYADFIFAVNPDIMTFLPQEKSMFLPYPGKLMEERIKTKIGNKINIVHSPTNREMKGSPIIINALKKVKEEYSNYVNVTIVENTPYKQALEIYKQADLVIDQVLAGWYGMFALDVMQMGIPVMAYIREEDLKYIPINMAKEVKQAIINVNPENIYIKIKSIIENPSILSIYKNNVVEYANKWHNPIKVARITKEIYEV